MSSRVPEAVATVPVTCATARAAAALVLPGSAGVPQLTEGAVVSMTKSPSYQSSWSASAFPATSVARL